MGIEEQRIQLNDMDILKDIIEPINNKEIKTANKAMQLNVTTAELKRHIKENGYKWLGSKYIKEGDDKIHKDSKMAHVTEKKIKVTYNISKELQKLVKLQSIIEDIDNSTVIEKAIEKYVSNKAKDMLKQI